MNNDLFYFITSHTNLRLTTCDNVITWSEFYSTVRQTVWQSAHLLIFIFFASISLCDDLLLVITLSALPLNQSLPATDKFTTYRHLLKVNLCVIGGADTCRIRWNFGGRALVSLVSLKYKKHHTSHIHPVHLRDLARILPEGDPRAARNISMIYWTRQEEQLKIRGIPPWLLPYLFADSAWPTTEPLHHEHF